MSRSSGVSASSWTKAPAPSTRERARHSTSKNLSDTRLGSMAGRRGTAIWSPEALADLDEIWSYYERVAGSNTAEKILREISEVVTTVEDHPFVGRSPINRGRSASLPAGLAP